MPAGSWKSPASSAGLLEIVEEQTGKLPAVMVTMMVMNRSIGRSNRTYQNRERNHREQNATKLH